MDKWIERWEWLVVAGFIKIAIEEIVLWVVRVV